MARQCPVRIPRLYAAASLKHTRRFVALGPAPGYSAALCRGLIEALEEDSAWRTRMTRIPRLYAAASLKPGGAAAHHPIHPTGYSAALCRGLIEAGSSRKGSIGMEQYSAALCRGLIEAPRIFSYTLAQPGGIPRLYAAASLKLRIGSQHRALDDLYSAALCRGLIEANGQRSRCDGLRFVFRGFMPRPH